MSIPVMITEVIIRIGYAFKRIKEGHSIKESIPVSYTHLYLYQKLLENLSSIENKEHFAKMILRISRGSIYDWCCHNGNYDLVEAVHEEISIVLDYIGL